MFQNHSKFGWNQAITKGTFPLRQNIYSSLSSVIGARWPKYYLSLPPVSSQTVQVGSKSGSNNRHFSPVAETVVRPSRVSHCSGVTPTSHVALPAHSPAPVQVLSKSGSNKGHFNLVAVTVFSPDLDSHWKGLKETSHVALPRHFPKPLQVWSKWGKQMALYSWGRYSFSSLSRLALNRGHSNSHVILPTHSAQPLYIWSKWGGKEGNFTLEAGTVFHPYLASYCSGVTQISHVALRPLAPQLVHVWSKSGSNNGHFNLKAEKFFLPVSPRIAAEGLKFHMWHSLPMLDNCCTFGPNWAVTKGTLLLRPKQFSVPISPRFATRWLKQHMWHPSSFSRSTARLVEMGQYKGHCALEAFIFFVLTSCIFSAGLLELYVWHSFPLQRNHCKFGPNRIVRKLLYSSGRNSFSSLCPQALQLGDWNITRDCPPYEPQRVQVLWKSSSKEVQFTEVAEKIFRPYLASHCSWVM
jgi:hypothetical protein